MHEPVSLCLQEQHTRRLLLLPFLSVFTSVRKILKPATHIQILKTNTQRQNCDIGHCLLKGSGFVALA